MTAASPTGAVALAALLTLAGCASPVIEDDPSGTLIQEPDGAAPAGPQDERAAARAAEMARALEGVRFVDGLVEVEPTGRNDPLLAETLIDHGAALLQINRPVAALAAYAEAARHHPDSAPAFAGVGEALIRKGRIDDASAAFRTALLRDESRDDVRYLLAVNETRARRFDVAISTMEDLLARDPQRGDAHERLSIWTYYTGDLAASRAHATAAAELGHPVPPQFLRRLDSAEAER